MRCVSDALGKQTVVLTDEGLDVSLTEMEKVSVLEFDSYRSYLKAVLTESQKRNPSFSLRAMARLTGMNPSHLSRTLNGQKSISASTAHQISLAFKLSPEESDHFIGLIELEKTDDETRKRRILKRMVERAKSSCRVVTIEAFQIISDWYHFAILALTKTKSFKSDPTFVAKRLGITPLTAKLAIERLLSAGFLVHTKSGYKAIDDADISTTDDISSAAIKENHAQHLQMAEKAMYQVPIHLREFNNLAIPINLEDVHEAKEMIREFVHRFNKKMSAEVGEEVFQFNVQFYRLSKGKINGVMNEKK